MRWSPGKPRDGREHGTSPLVSVARPPEGGRTSRLSVRSPSDLRRSDRERLSVGSPSGLRRSPSALRPLSVGSPSALRPGLRPALRRSPSGSPSNELPFLRGKCPLSVALRPRRRLDGEPRRRPDGERDGEPTETRRRADGERRELTTSVGSLPRSLDLRADSAPPRVLIAFRAASRHSPYHRRPERKRLQNRAKMSLTASRIDQSPKRFVAPRAWLPKRDFQLQPLGEDSTAGARKRSGPHPGAVSRVTPTPSMPRPPSRRAHPPADAPQARSHAAPGEYRRHSESRRRVEPLLARPQARPHSTPG